MLQNVSTLIGQLNTVYIYDWLTKMNKIHEPSCLLFNGTLPSEIFKLLNPFKFTLTPPIYVSGINPALQLFTAPCKHLTT